jgi:anti-anti-sigma regulatory factor
MRQTRDPPILRLLSGALDLAVAAEVETTILGLCGEGVSGIELNLSQLTFMDSSVFKRGCISLGAPVKPDLRID